jgi:hypothetical protein
VRCLGTGAGRACGSTQQEEQNSSTCQPRIATSFREGHHRKLLYLANALVDQSGVRKETDDSICAI